MMPNAVSMTSPLISQAIGLLMLNNCLTDPLHDKLRRFMIALLSIKLKSSLSLNRCRPSIVRRYQRSLQRESSIRGRGKSLKSRDARRVPHVRAVLRRRQNRAPASRGRRQKVEVRRLVGDARRVFRNFRSTFRHRWPARLRKCRQLRLFGEFCSGIIFPKPLNSAFLPHR